MKIINFNVLGDPGTDVPSLLTDDGSPEVHASLTNGRASFVLPETAQAGTGATIHYNGTSLRVLVPPDGAWEADLPPVRPPEATGSIALVYAHAAPALGIQGARFVNRGEPWTWRGCSDFRLPARFMARENVRAVLDDRKAVGATILRCFAMKANNIGWELRPGGDEYFLEVGGFFEILGVAGFACEWTVFADTRALMADPVAQLDFWHQTIDVARDYPHVVLELVNEAGHPTQDLHADRFDRPTGVLASHGSGLEDTHPPDPWWDFAGYHARRNPLPDARGFTNYNPYEFEARYPQPCPLIADEGLKPQDYRFDPGIARLMGTHASCGAGGTFHSDEGIQSVVFSAETRACAAAFFEALS